MSHEPEWVHWDPETYAAHFQGRELVQGVQPYKASGPATTYRNDFPVPPLHWSHRGAPDRSFRPTPEFGHTTSHRADFTPYPVGSSGAAPIRPYPEQKFKPKLQGATTARLDFKIPQLTMPQQRDNKYQYKPSDAPIGTTTMRADYVKWSFPGGRPEKPEIESRPTKFYGMTTTRADSPFPKELPPPRVTAERPPHVVPEFGGTTEYRAAYENVKLPPGLPADIGIQVASKMYKKGGVGGQFDCFIKVGQPSPCTISKVYTLAGDMQQSAAIVVISKRPENVHGVIIGHFTMEGIKPEVAGVSKVEVTLKLSSEKTLQVQAVYKNGKKVKQLTFKSKSGPALRTVAQASDVPNDA